MWYLVSLELKHNFQNKHLTKRSVLNYKLHYMLFKMRKKVAEHLQEVKGSFFVSI